MLRIAPPVVKNRDMGIIAAATLLYAVFIGVLVFAAACIEPELVHLPE